MSDNGVQLDLFGGPCSEEERKIERQIAREGRVELVERGEWESPLPNIPPTLGYRCPDCHMLEPSGYRLKAYHGWDPDVPDSEPAGGRCYRVQATGGDPR